MRSIFLLACGFATALFAAELRIKIPDGIDAKSAIAVNAADQSQYDATVSDGVATFADLPDGVAIDVHLLLADETIIQGANLTWSEDEPADPNAKPLSANDLQQIHKLMTDIKAFTNKNEMLFLRGTAERAVGLVRLIRDKDFYADKGGEIIWRIEIWFFKSQYGGWEKVQQSNKILHRIRFRTVEEFEAKTSKLKFEPELGGIVLTAGEKREILLPATAGEPTLKLPAASEEEDE